MCETQFKQLFDEIPSYGIPERYFDSRSSLFNDRCKKVVSTEMKGLQRIVLNTCPVSPKTTGRNWIKNQKRNTLYRVLQYMQNEAFPVKPVYAPPPYSSFSVVPHMD